MRFLSYLTKIPRRFIFLAIALAVAIPLVIPIGIPVNVMPQSKRLFEAVDSLNSESKPILISCDFDPQSLPELYPMLMAITRQCYAKNIKVILMALWPQGTGMVEMALDELSTEFTKEYGVDYAFLGYKFGVAAVLLGMGENISGVFPVDYYGTPVDSLPLLRSVRNYKDISLIITLSTGDPGWRQWLLYAQSRYRARLGVGVTAVSAADVYPYVETKQVTGFLAGMKGASEYENLVQEKGYSTGIFRATQGMDAQSLGHLLIMIFIILGNVGYFYARRQK
ncbi:MAG: hypothetical protein JSW49_07595 [candidate division WOR-3 bacterium]|nr:MAG: hypothetical protein JSW49_07595 [candidate division WOR-3 bacterium]